MQKVAIQAALNPVTNEPVYGDCTLSVGDGSVKISFVHGRAIVDLDVAQKYLVNNGAIEIPALGILRSRQIDGDANVATRPEDLLGGGIVGVPVAADVEALTHEGPSASSLADLSPEQRLEIAKELMGLIQEDQATASEPSPEPAAATGEPEPAEPGEATDEEAEEPVEETAQQRAIREAQEHLAGEGVEPAQPSRVVPEGFDDATAEGEPRCLATKADGTQCQNAAKDKGPACQVSAHQAQFANAS